jgi:hypothetical protein
MVHGAVRAVGALAAGAGGAVVLGTALNTGAVLIETARRVVVKIIDATPLRFDTNKEADDQVNIDTTGLRPFLPYAPTNTRYVDWTSLAVAGLKNAAAATAAIFVLNRWAPSVVANANKIVGYVIPIQFTAGSLGLARFVNF